MGMRTKSLINAMSGLPGVRADQEESGMNAA
jgi:hypothetical protein